MRSAAEANAPHVPTVICIMTIIHLNALWFALQAPSAAQARQHRRTSAVEAFQEPL
jgi:hypothetical protein